MPTLYDADGNEVEIPDNIGDLRSQVETLTKEVRDLSKENKGLKDEVLPVRADRRKAAVEGAFTEAGVSDPRAIKVFMATNPDTELSAETIAAFADEYGFGPEPAAEPNPQPKVETPTPYQPVTDAPAVGGQTMIPEAEYIRLMSTEPARAKQYFNAGLVEWKRPDLMDQYVARVRS